MGDQDTEWRDQLSDLAYRVTRKGDTERPYTGKYYLEERNGKYFCICCNHLLFTSEMKYHSGCGWPAFYEAMPDKIQESADNSFGMTRIEITCENCGGHLGHVFNDGPQPSGLRYCVNSISLDFDSKDKDD